MSDNGLVDWGDIDSSGRGNRANIEYLRLREGQFKVRLFDRPKLVLRYYLPGAGSVIVDPENDIVAARQPNLKLKRRYAIIVIDRLDNNKVKIMEGPGMVFEPFKNFYEANGIEPGSAEGTDWIIKVTGSGVNTRYTVQALMKASPFTDEELAEIKHKRQEEGYDLERLFKVTPIDKVEEKLAAAVDEADAGQGDYRTAQAQSQTQAQPQPQTQGTPSNKQDFNF